MTDFWPSAPSPLPQHRIQAFVSSWRGSPILWGFSLQQCRQGMSSACPTVVQTSLTITSVTSPCTQLACSDTTVANVILLIFSSLITVPTVSVILVSYAYILVTICRMRFPGGPAQGLSTCASHLHCPLHLSFQVRVPCVSQPNPESVSAYNKLLSVFYTIVIPMLNPPVYSLRNKDVKAAVS